MKRREPQDEEGAGDARARGVAVFFVQDLFEPPRRPSARVGERGEKRGEKSRRVVRRDDGVVRRDDGVEIDPGRVGFRRADDGDGKAVHREPRRGEHVVHRSEKRGNAVIIRGFCGDQTQHIGLVRTTVVGAGDAQYGARDGLGELQERRQKYRPVRVLASRRRLAGVSEVHFSVARRARRRPERRERAVARGRHERHVSVGRRALEPSHSSNGLFPILFPIHLRCISPRTKKRRTELALRVRAPDEHASPRLGERGEVFVPGGDGDDALVPEPDRVNAPRLRGVVGDTAAERAAGPGAPGEDVAGRDDGDDGFGRAGDGNRRDARRVRRGDADAFRDERVLAQRRAAVPELASLVPAPGVHAPARCDRRRVRVAGGDAQNALRAGQKAPRDARGRVARRAMPETELPRVVGAERVDVSRAGEREDVPSPARDALEA